MKVLKRPKIVKFKKGNNLSSKVNVIPNGVLHSDENNIPDSHNLGNKGIPMVTCNLENTECIRTAEIEKEELVIHKDLNNKLEQLVNRYNSTNNDSVLYSIGELFWNELERNTIDYTRKILK